MLFIFTFVFDKNLGVMNLLTIFMGSLGVTEIVLIIAVILLMFGGKKIPELMKGLGSGIKEFKNAAKDDSSTTKTKVSEKEEK